jgi:hypothetical protein
MLYGSLLCMAPISLTGLSWTIGLNCLLFTKGVIICWKKQPAVGRDITLMVLLFILATTVRQILSLSLSRPHSNCTSNQHEVLRIVQMYRAVSRGPSSLLDIASDPFASANALIVEIMVLIVDAVLVR